MDQHTLHVATTHDDGHTDTSARTQEGTAQEAHDALARRWKNAGYDHQRDKTARTLTRVQLDGSTVVVTHRGDDVDLFGEPV